MFKLLFWWKREDLSRDHLWYLLLDQLYFQTVRLEDQDGQIQHKGQQRYYYIQVGQGLNQGVHVLLPQDIN